MIGWNGRHASRISIFYWPTVSGWANPVQGLDLTCKSQGGNISKEVGKGLAALTRF